VALAVIVVTATTAPILLSLPHWAPISDWLFLSLRALDAPARELRGDARQRSLP
jgi:hypothetical protein